MMTKAQGKVFAFAGAMVVFAVARWGLNYAGEHGLSGFGRSVLFDDGESRALVKWGKVAGGCGVVMALLCMGAMQKATWGREREWMRFAVRLLVLLGVMFILFS